MCFPADLICFHSVFPPSGHHCQLDKTHCDTITTKKVSTTIQKVRGVCVCVCVVAINIMMMCPISEQVQ